MLWRLYEKSDRESWDEDSLKVARDNEDSEIVATQTDRD